MKFRSTLILCLLIITYLLPVPAAFADTDGWLPVGPGVDFQRFAAPGPNNVFVARMDRSNPNLIVESSIGQGRLTGGTEKVSSMFQRYDQAINFWGDPAAPVRELGWGGRNRVIVAINGFFYGGTEEPPGVPWSGQIHSGWYAKRYDLWGEGFVWKADRTPFMGECADHRSSKNYVSIPGDSRKVGISEVNVPRGSNELILYTPQWDVNTGTSDGLDKLEILVEMDEAAMILPGPDYAAGTIREIRDELGSTPIPFDHVVLSAKNGPREELLALNLKVGDEIRITQEISESDPCDNPPTESWKESYAGIGGYPILLRDGVAPSFDGVGGAFVRNPRTVIAFNEDYIFFVVVDGRNPGISVGMNYPELAAFLRDVLEADWAINQDGGGSSTLVINGQVMNNTYCNETFCSSTNTHPTPEITIPAEGTPPPDVGRLIPEGADDPFERLGGASSQVYLPMVTRNYSVIQRPVANGMMIVYVEPMVTSNAFNSGQAITTVGAVDIRLGPGTNYGVLTSVPGDSLGVIQDHSNGLDGVFAKGEYWWKVGIGTTSGWVAQSSLIAFNWVSESRFLDFPISLARGIPKD